MGGVILFAVTTYLEKYLLETNGLVGKLQRDHYLSSTFSAICLFLTFLNIDLRDNLFSKLGREVSLPVYIFHPIVIILLTKFIVFIGLHENISIQCLVPFGVIILTIIAVMSYKRLSLKISYLRIQKKRHIDL